MLQASKSVCIHSRCVNKGYIIAQKEFLVKGRTDRICKHYQGGGVSLYTWSEQEKHVACINVDQ